LFISGDVLVGIARVRCFNGGRHGSPLPAEPAPRFACARVKEKELDSLLDKLAVGFRISDQSVSCGSCA
jgi:hypothetical protein